MREFKLDWIQGLIQHEFKLNDPTCKVLNKPDLIAVTCLFDGKTVLRLTETLQLLLNNFYALQKIEQLKIAPTQQRMGLFDGVYYSTEEFLPGVEPTTLPPLAPLFKKIHAITSETPGYVSVPTSDWKPFVLDQKLGSSAIDLFISETGRSDIVEYLHEQCPTCSIFSLLHGSPSYCNIVVEEGVPSFIDFQSSCFGDKAYDIGYLYAYEPQTDEKLIEELGYNRRDVFYYALLVGIKRYTRGNTAERKVDDLQRIEKTLALLRK